MIEYLSPQYHLINYMFCRVAKLSYRDAEDLWKSAGVKACYENIRKKMMTPDQALVLWESRISESAPYILRPSVAANEICESLSIPLRLPSLCCTADMIKDVTPTYHLIDYILWRCVGLPTTASRTLLQNVGVNSCLNDVSNDLMTAKQARELWVGHVSNRLPSILKRAVASERKPKRDKLHRLTALDTYHAPPGFEDDMREVLLPSDWGQLQAALEHKLSNCKAKGQLCYLDIFHVILMLAAYRLDTGDRRELAMFPKEFPICRFQDALEQYSIFDCAFDSRANNTCYNMSRIHRDACLNKLNYGKLDPEDTKKELKKLVGFQKIICEIDEVMRERIELQLTLQDKYFYQHKRFEARPDYILHFENQTLIIIEDNPNLSQPSVFENLEFVLHDMIAKGLIKNQSWFCKTRSGAFHKIMYIRSEPFAMKMLWPVSDHQAAFLENIVSSAA